jgi:uncharacterized protein (DUF849 family)
MVKKKVVLTAALTGGQTRKERAPALPVTAEEIAADVIACAHAGAAICHIHVRDENMVGTMNLDIFTHVYETIQKAIKAAGLDVIINLTTSGGVASDDQRMAHLISLQPEMCSYDAGSINWYNDNIFINSPTFLKKLGTVTKEHKVKPEIEVFDTHMIKIAVRNMKEGYLEGPLHFQFVLGTYGGMDATVENLVTLKSHLPEGATFSVVGVGAASVPMMMAALAMGADGIRVGLEDNIYMSKGVPATNAMQVQRAAELIRLAGADVATAAEARKLLNFPIRE